MTPEAVIQAASLALWLIPAAAALWWGMPLLAGGWALVAPLAMVVGGYMLWG